MALRAIVTEITRDMIRVCCLLEIRLMALVAILIDKLIVATYVARLTLLRDMCAC
jgi:hypothetical protein